MLELENIGHDDSFIQLGGQSITAMRIVSRISEEFSVDIKIKTFFALKTIHRLSEYILAQQEKQSKIPCSKKLPIQSEVSLHNVDWFERKLS